MNLTIKFKIIKKTVSFLLAVLMLVNLPMVAVVYAEGEPTDTPTPTPEQFVSPEPTNDPSPTQAPADPTPTELPQSIIDTGDASADSVNDTTVNSNTDLVDGVLDTPAGECSAPEGQTSCPDNIDINNVNQGTVSGELAVLAETGSNTASFGGDVTITTGDATASGDIANNINENAVVFNQNSSEEQNPSPSPSEQSTETKDLNVSNENNGAVQNNAEVKAETGNNVASENLGDVDLKTGDAYSWVNLLNFLNTNIVGSNFEVMVLDINNEEGGDIDLNEIWKALQAGNVSDSVSLEGDLSSHNLRLVIKNSNNGEIKNTINVCAITGGNQANENQSADIESGNATALANVTNIINTNILGSKFFFGIINITGQFSGNLILPSPEKFLNAGGTGIGGTPVIFDNQNSAAVNDNVSSLADSGGNQINNNGGNNSINTGNAQSTVNDFSLVNLNLYKNDWFYLLINTLGSWSGKTYGWASPDSQEEVDGLSNEYTTSSGEPEGLGGSVSPVDFQNQNTARVENNINVLASSGGNQANGNKAGANINTGNTKAGLNLINLVNLNILASRWFMSLVNILGNWSGNTVFANPDLTVSLSASRSDVFPGESMEYILNYGNIGYEDAQEVTLKIELPEGVDYESDNSGVGADCADRVCIWELGKLNRSQNGSFMVEVKIDPDIFSFEKISFWQKLVPSVYAAEGAERIYTKALINTIDSESDNNNNVSETFTNVKVPAISGVDSTEGSIDQRLPVLEVTAENNVNEFVYAGDTVTFFVKIKNSGEVPSRETYLSQELFNGVSEGFSVPRINIGTIEPGKTAKVSFGMTLADAKKFHSGSYHTITKAIGKAPNETIISSNEARTDFKIKFNGIPSSVLPEEVGINEKKEEVLGALDQVNEVPKEKIYPYIMMLIFSSLWIVDRSRRLSKKYFLGD